MLRFELGAIDPLTYNSSVLEVSNIFLYLGYLIFILRASLPKIAIRAKVLRLVFKAQDWASSRNIKRIKLLLFGYLYLCVWVWVSCYRGRCLCSCGMCVLILSKMTKDERCDDSFFTMIDWGWFDVWFTIHSTIYHIRSSYQLTVSAVKAGIYYILCEHFTLHASRWVWTGGMP